MRILLIIAVLTAIFMLVMVGVSMNAFDDSCLRGRTTC